MIESLVGEVAFQASDRVVVSVSGVGYGVTMTPTELSTLNIGQEVRLSIYTMVKEDTLKLFGFLEVASRELFEVLIGVSGVGPKMALAMLTVLPGVQLVRVVQQEDLQALQSVPGIGRRTAEKIMLELKNRLERLQWIFSCDETALVTETVRPEDAKTNTMKRDLHSALENLGFRPRDIERALHALEAAAEWKQNDFSFLMKAALTELTPSQKGQRAGLPLRM
ncbi:MAG: Holliday junction branch migration protein RuvA [Oligoflexales bacterium]